MQKTVVLLLLVIPACAPRSDLVGDIAPRPNLLLAPRSTPLELRFAAEVPESIPVGMHYFAGRDQLDGWHEALSRGFHAGFDRFFGKTGTPEQLVVLKTEASYYGGTIELRYQAELRDGDVVKTRFAGTARITLVGSIKECWARVVEAMYEQIGQQMNK